MAAGALTAALAFLLLARWILSGDAMPFDLAVREWVNGWATPGLTWVMIGITTCGSERVLVPLGVFLCCRFALTGRRRPAIVFGAVTLSAELMSQMLKVALHRPRPTVFFGLTPAETYSLPSGHSFMSVV